MDYGLDIGHWKMGNYRRSEIIQITLSQIVQTEIYASSNEKNSETVKKKG